MMVSSEPKGGHIDDYTDQNAGDRLGKGHFRSAQSDRMGRFYITVCCRGRV
jgi:hypothetical protein